MKVGVRSDKGTVRKINEDNFNIILGDNGIPYCFIVADGMGGHNSGEVASKMAVDHVTEFLHNDSWRHSGEHITKTIEKAIKEANKKIYQNSKTHCENQGMGTTIIVSILYNNKVYIGHVGDSRVYLIRDDNIAKLTTDHSYIEELINTGTLTREEAEKHPKKNIITRAVGYTNDIIVDICESEFRAGDIYLLCTDGLTNKLSEAELLEVIKAGNDLQSVCDSLVAMANEKGGEDNVTVLIFSK